MKLYGKEFTSNNHTPPYCGQITRKWVYDRVLPKELQKEIDGKINKEDINGLLKKMDAQRC